MEESKKLSVDYCKKLLKKGGHNYADDQVKKIRDFMYILGEIDYHYFTKFLFQHEKKSDSLH